MPDGATCEKCNELSDAVSDLLIKLISLTSAQLKALHFYNDAELMRLDAELERTIGLKERLIGALREHKSAHEKTVPSLVPDQT